MLEVRLKQKGTLFPASQLYLGGTDILFGFWHLRSEVFGSMSGFQSTEPSSSRESSCQDSFTIPLSRPPLRAFRES